MLVPLGGLQGQERAVWRLRAMLTARRLPHALLFVGPRGVGKRTAALGLAAGLNCLEPTGPGEACGACGPCHKIAEGIHPDIVALAPQGPGNVIAIGEQRDLAGRLGYLPHEAKVRVVLMRDADRLNDAAANAFLKTLEEPPPRTHFILQTAAPERLPATIHSRCQRVPFLPLATPALIQVLQAAGVAADKAAAAAAQAGGSAARAVELTSGEELEKRRGRVRALAAAARSGSLKAASDAAGDLAGDKEEIAPTLELLGAWYRDAAAMAAGAPRELLSHAGDDLPALEVEAQGREPAELARRAGAVLDAQKALIGNASAGLAIERLLVCPRP